MNGNIVEQIAAARKQKGISQEVMAAKIGLPLPSLYLVATT